MHFDFIEIQLRNTRKCKSQTIMDHLGSSVLGNTSALYVLKDMRRVEDEQILS